MRALAHEQTIHEMFRAEARLAPRNPAVCRGDECLSYEELDSRSDSIAASLIRLGVRPGDPVGILAGRSVEMVTATLGALKAGAHYVPIDPSLPAARKRFIIEDTALKIVVCEDEVRADDSYDGVEMHTVADLERSSIPSELPAMPADSLAYVMYTSGSTGKPKGVLISHGSVLNLAKDNDYVPLEPGDRLLLTGSIGFDLTTFEIWGSLLNGLTLYLPDNDAALLDGRAFGAMLTRHGITTVGVSTTLCVRLVSQDAAVFRPLKYLLIGGDVLLRETCHLIHSLCPKVRIINAYGPTECTTFATTFTVGPGFMLTVPIGKPLRNVTAHVVNDAGEVIHDDMPGELLIGGAHLARGYLNRPELTKERFIEHPELGRVYRSGDLVRRRADGNLEFLGRKDRQVKVGGYRIELSEVEAAIAAVPGILGCAVRTWEHDREKFIAAYYVGHNAGDPEAIRQRLQERLPAYMVPTFLYRLDALPLDAHGKVDQAALPDPFAENKSLKLAALQDQDRGELRDRILHSWQKALGLDHAGTDEDFYDVGGTSIQAVHLMGMLQAQGIALSLGDILHYRTVDALTDYARARRGDDVLLRDEGEVVDDLRATHPGVEFQFAKIQSHKHVNPVAVLHCDRPVAAEELLARLSRTTAPEWRPHYVVQNAPEPPADEKELVALLGLRGPSEIDLESLQRRVQDDIDRNDQRLKSGRALDAYPFSPMQALQFNVHVPPSKGAFRVDAHLDLHLLNRAFTQLLEDQGLLRSVPVEKENALQWQEYELRSDCPPEPTFLDLSSFWLSAEEASALIVAVIDSVRFQDRGLQYHVIVARRNEREYGLVLVFHHVLFDRVSMEVIERELMSRYRELASGSLVARRDTARFADYVRHIYDGPRGITQQELVERFRLQEFHAAKTALLASPRTQPVDRSYWFEIAALAPEHMERGHSVGTALSLYARAIREVFGVDRTPMLFVHDGRRYGNREYYDLVGEHIDFVPLVVDAEDSPAAIQRSVHERLALLSRYSVNFVYLMLRPVKGWEDVARLVDPGDGIARLDVCMFNYMGNQPLPGSCVDHAAKEVNITPNPLPIHSFLNCIVVSFTDGFLFQFRSSYEPHVDELRAAFARLSAAEPQAGGIHLVQRA